MRQAKKIMAAGGKVSNNRFVQAVYGNYTLGMIVRAGQARRVASEIAQSNVPCSVCGDFNDVPYSFVYNTVKGDMVDGFKECGAGWMYTYRGMKRQPVRIDYIFHDESIKGIAYYRSDLTYSDHFPVFMKIAL
jgi:endonuclease/exonuclease/phosphatase (EEP) superfamily protein YafD